MLFKDHNKNRTKSIMTIILAGMLLFGSVPASAISEKENETVTSLFAADYQSTVYNRNNGLVVNEINDMTQSGDGYIWIATYSGLLRYNGSGFERMDISDEISSVRALYVDENDILWIGTNDSGIFAYDGEACISYSKSESGLISDSIRSLGGDGNGNIYAGTTEGIVKILKDGTIINLDETARAVISSLDCSSDGYLLGVTDTNELLIVKDDELVIAVNEETCGELIGDAVFCEDEIVASDLDGRLLRVSRTTGETDVLFEPPEETAGIGEVCSITPCDELDGYFLCGDAGMVFVSAAGAYSSVTIDNFSSSVIGMFEDYQENYWFYSDKLGIAKLSPNPFHDCLKAADETAQVVNSVIISDGLVYVGCNDGLRILDEETGENIQNRLTDYFTDEKIKNIMLDSKGNLWFSTYGVKGLVCYTATGKMRLYNDTISEGVGNQFRLCVELADGGYVAAGSNGLVFISEKGIVEGLLTQENGLDTTTILTIYQREDGTILAGSDGSGIYMINDMKVVDCIDYEDGLESLVVLRIVGVKGGCIYVTSNSLYYAADVADSSKEKSSGSTDVTARDTGKNGEGTSEASASVSVRRLQNFIYNNNYDIYIDNSGNAWITGSDGIYIVSESDLIADTEDYSYVHLDMNRGLTSSLTSNSWNTSDEKGNLYFCCTETLMRISESDNIKGNDNYNIVIEGMEADGELISLSDGRYVIPAGSKRLVITPAVLNYSLSDPRLYMYMEGFEEEGVYVNQNELDGMIYTNIEAGTYTFHLQVIDELTGKVLKETTVTIIKQAKIYEKGWFKLLIILIIVAVIVTITKMTTDLANVDKLKEAKAEADSANVAKTRFLAHMSHEIRTPINSIIGMNEMILRENRDTAIEGYALNIEHASRMLLDLINDVLDFSKIESGSDEIEYLPYNLDENITGCVELLKSRAEEKGLDVVISINKDLPYAVKGDHTKVRQIITNILSNAVKYTQNGHIALDVTGREVDGSYEFKIVVEDTGCGIKEEQLPKIFESFTRVEEEDSHIQGTGLGLSITRKLISKMGGEIEVKSEYGVGSEFIVYLPQGILSEEELDKFKADEAKKALRNDKSRYFMAPKARILVVDDNKMNLTVIEHLLKRTEIQLELAGDGREAFNKCRSIKFDLILMDHMMPKPDGIETFHMIRNDEIGLNRETRMVVFTANAIAGVRDRYLKEGFAEYIAKPVSATELEASLIRNLPEELVEFGYINDKQENIAANEALDFKAGNGSSENGTVVNEAGSLSEAVPPCINREKGIKIYCGGDESIYRELLRIFYEEHEGVKAEITCGFKNGDRKSLKLQLHSLKSAAKTIGADRLGELAREAERADTEGTAEELGGRLAELMPEYDRTITEISMLLQEAH